MSIGKSSSASSSFALARIVICHGRAPSQKCLVAIGAVQDQLDEGQAFERLGLFQGRHQFLFSPHRLAVDRGLALQGFDILRNKDVGQNADEGCESHS